MEFTQQRRKSCVSEESFSFLVEENTLKVPMESQCCPSGCQIVPVWKFVALWPSEKEEQDIILISDDDDEVQCPDDDDKTQGSSVVIVEPQGKSCSLKDSENKLNYFCAVLKIWPCAA